MPRKPYLLLVQGYACLIHGFSAFKPQMSNAFVAYFFNLGALTATQFAVIYLEEKLILRLIALGEQT